MLSFFFFIFVNSAFCSSSYEGLLNSKTQSSFADARKELELAKTHQLACYWEIESELPPAHCYLAVQKSDNRKDETRKLNQRCKTSAQRQRSISVLDSKLKVKGLSRVCRGLIKTQIELLQYQNEEFRQ